MEAVLDILKFIIPALVVFGVVYFMLDKFFTNERDIRYVQMRREQQGGLTPIRLQAYERVVLFLERISPGSLISRTHKNGMSAKMLQAELLKAIRTEFEHNLSQQIYVSKASWELVKNAKEEMIKLVNMAAINLAEDASGLQLGELILKVAMSQDRLPTHIAIDYLKDEVKENF